MEETDLTDAAISDRLRQDLHTRVIATRLLQRYGYLLPKVNPDSKLAAEHNLEMRARVQELERASESHEANRAAPQTVITVGSSPSSEPSTNRGRALQQPLSDEKWPAAHNEPGRSPELGESGRQGIWTKHAA